MIKILFLDIDGVMNSSEDGFTHDITTEKISLLKQIVEKTDCKIVLSSSWRNVKRFRLEFEKQMSENDIEIFSQTPYLPAKCREDEIMKYLDTYRECHMPFKYAVLDDDDLNIGNFVRTNYNYGLQQSHVDNVIKILNA